MFKEIQAQPEKLFEIIRVDIRETVGSYLFTLIGIKLTHFLGREAYERGHGEVNHRNGSYDRQFTLKGIKEVQVEVPRHRKRDFNTQIITCGKQHEDALREDLTLMVLTGISTRSVSMISNKAHRPNALPCRSEQRQQAADRGCRVVENLGSLHGIDYIALFLMELPSIFS